MKRSLHKATGLLVIGAALGGVGFAVESMISGDDDDDSEQPITGSALVKATAAALAHTGGGTVTETEVGDEESYYEVEVTFADGRQVDVQLDRSFQVVSTGDDDEEDEDGNGQ